MTLDETKKALLKFTAYLEANGTHVMANALYVDIGGPNTIAIGLGTMEVIDEMLLRILADRHGWKLVEK